MDTIRRIAVTFAVNTISLVSLLVFVFMATRDWVFPDQMDWVQLFCAAGVASTIFIAGAEATAWALNAWARSR